MAILSPSSLAPLNKVLNIMKLELRMQLIFHFRKYDSIFTVYVYIYNSYIYIYNYICNSNANMHVSIKNCLSCEICLIAYKKCHKKVTQ